MPSPRDLPWTRLPDGHTWTPDLLPDGPARDDAVIVQRADGTRLIAFWTDRYQEWLRAFPEPAPAESAVHDVVAWIALDAGLAALPNASAP